MDNRLIFLYRFKSFEQWSDTEGSLILEYAKKKIAVFKPKIDDRYSEECVVSHCGSTAKSFVINRAHEIFDYIDDSYDVIAIDEVQFFDEETKGSYQ